MQAQRSAKSKGLKMAEGARREQRQSRDTVGVEGEECTWQEGLVAPGEDFEFYSE